MSVSDLSLGAPALTEGQNASEGIASLRAGLSDARRRSDELFAIVKPDLLYERPIPERHRIIFYLGHLEAFDWNLLNQRLFDVNSFNPELDRLFAFGIDPVDGGLPNDKPSEWPAVEQVRNYVRLIRETIDRRLQDGTPTGARVKGRPAGGATGQGAKLTADVLLNVAIEHRLMHAETLAYMFHQLPFDSKVRQVDTVHPECGAVDLRMIDIPAGFATLGLNRSTGRFGWDNEFEALRVEVPAFTIDRYKITNAQYLEFIQADGYATRSYWNDSDWEWKTGNQISHPAFWKRNGDDWFYRGMFSESPLLATAPVYVSHAEAQAYARWAGKDLPTEAEWHRAAFGNAKGNENIYPWGLTAPDARFGNFNFAHWDPTAVNAFPDGDSSLGVADLLGNGWEWTSTEFAPFPGFEPFSFYPGYSANFFDGKHFVLKGGSPRTASSMLRRSFRNWFQPHYQYVYAGFRCVSR